MLLCALVHFSAGLSAMATFTKINFSVTDDTPPPLQERLRSFARVETTMPDGRRIGGRARQLELPSEVEDPLARSNTEAAGRLFLQTYLEDDGMLEVTAPSRPELVPDM